MSDLLMLTAEQQNEQLCRENFELRRKLALAEQAADAHRTLIEHAHLLGDRPEQPCRVYYASRGAYQNAEPTTIFPNWPTRIAAIAAVAALWVFKLTGVI